VGAFVRAATGTEPSPELVSEIAAAANGNPAAAVRALTGLRLGHGQAMQRDHSRDERRSA
jgi:hypothetical protein